MRTFTDWLHYYNNLDVGPGLEALEKMRAFYTEKGIDILKDAVSIPEVSLHYLLRGVVERGADLYSPFNEAYDMLKEPLHQQPGKKSGKPGQVWFNQTYQAFVKKTSLVKSLVRLFLPGF